MQNKFGYFQIFPKKLGNPKCDPVIGGGVTSKPGLFLRFHQEIRIFCIFISNLPLYLRYYALKILTYRKD